MEPFLGEIRLFPYGYAPRGWALCNGALLPINQNQALFALLGDKFGGDLRTTFGLPTLKGPANDTDYYIAMTGVFPAKQ